VPVAVGRQEPHTPVGRGRERKQASAERDEESRREETPVTDGRSLSRGHAERLAGRLARIVPMPPRASRVLFWAVAACLALAGAGLVLDHTRLDSPTMDEPFHALAAAEYAIAGTYYANLEHPPFAKFLSGLALRAAGARAPRVDVPFSMRTAEQPRQFVFQSPLPPERLFATARQPFLFLFAALILAVAGMVRHWAGPVAGLLAAALVAFEPNLVAHAGVIHTDLAAALGFFGTISLSLLALERRSLLLWSLAGLALGLSLASKFSAVFLVPIVSVLALAGLLVERRRDVREKRLPGLVPLGGLVLAGAVSALALWGAYALAMRSMTPSEAATAARMFLKSREAPPETVERVLKIGRLSPEIGHYAAGLAGIAVQNRTGGGVNYLRGRLSVAGFWDYFFVAFAVKSSLAFLLLLLAALLVALTRRLRPDFTLLALVLPVVYLFLSGMATSYNIGIRHMLPVYPLLAAAAALVVTRALPAKAATAALALAALLQLLEISRVHPHELSFFNVAAGGPERGGEWLNDSNLDWGQDLMRLGLELKRRGWAADTTVAYFGGADPEYYAPGSRIFVPDRGQVPPGLYAVSSFLLCCGPEVMSFHGDHLATVGFERLRQAVRRRGESVGRVGYSILLFRIRP
jgi:hypothetical protein